MKKRGYRSLEPENEVDRRQFLKIGGAAGAGWFLGNRFLWSHEAGQNAPAQKTPPTRPKTNLEDPLKVPKTKYSLPGPFPGKVVEVHHPDAMKDEKPNADVIKAMFEKGMTRLTDKNLKASVGLFFTNDDVVGIKVNPVGPGLISTRLEVVDAIITWLLAGGIKRPNIIIWDRFDYMLRDAGYTAERYPGIGIEGLQTMDEAAAEGKHRTTAAG